MCSYRALSLYITEVNDWSNIAGSIIVQGGATDTATFVLVTECRHGHQSGRTIAHSKAENVEFFAITI